MWINVGVEVVVVRRRCGSAVVPGVSVFVAGPTLRCRVRCCCVPGAPVLGGASACLQS